MTPMPLASPKPTTPAGSLARRRRWLLLWMIGTPLLLAALIAFHALKPSPEEKQVSDFSEKIISREHGQRLNRQEQEELRQQWDRFSPETRQQIFTNVAKDMLERFREEAVKYTPEERSKRVQQEIVRMRQQRDQLTEEQRQRIRARISTDQGKEMVKNILTFFQSELTAKERAELDPLVHEYLYQVDQLFSR